jgi:two-component system cell cycle sensor histidine kinase/response regulator CckA
MNGKGLLTISTRSERLSEPYHFGADIIKPGDFIVISVSDTGCGIPPENINRIFEPFFSTKKNVVGSGTGLGLAMVYGIVRQTEGFIVVHSEVGKGTTFEIYLPAYESDKQEVVATEQKEEVIRDKSGKAAMTTPVNIGGANKPILGMNVSKFDSQRKVVHNPGETRILFVEDEDAVRTVGARGLRQKGFDVVDCISAENALEHIENGEHFDLMITDMMMPGMSGADLAKVMHKKNPQTLIILASGYSEEIARKELAGSQDFYFIGKPYSLENLREKIMEVLAENDRNNG